MRSERHVRPGHVAPDESGARESGRSRSRVHLRDIDAMRVIVFSFVIAAHVVTTIGDFERRSVAGWGMLMHFTRYAFVFISAFVLMFSYRDRPMSPVRFWRRRFGAVVLPYLVWSAIYYSVALTVDSEPGWWRGFGRFGLQLASGGVWYHLYFLLISIQLYAIFPLLHRLMRGASLRRSAWVLVGSAVVQLGSMALVSMVKAPTSIAGYFWHHPDIQLPIYTFFIAAGIVAAIHREALNRWLLGSPVLISVLFGVGMVISTGIFWYRSLSGSAMLASLPAYPGIFPWIVGATLAVYALCVAWDRRALPDGWSARLAAAGAHRAFGVFALHPLVLWALTRWLLPSLNTIGIGIGTELLIIGVGTVVGTVAIVEVLLRTPASKVLTARPRLRWRRQTR